MVPAIKLLQLGELKSQSLGFKRQQVMFLILTLASIITAVAIAYTGIIGFIGMIVPPTDKTLLLEIYFRHSNDIKYF